MTHARTIPEEVWQQVIGAVASGLTQRDACDLCNVGEATLYEKKKKDSAFSRDLLKAHSAFKMTHIGNIAKASKVSWQASAWLLERKFPQEFGTQARLDVNVSGDGVKPPSWFGQDLTDVEEAEVIESKQLTQGDEEDDN